MNPLDALKLAKKAAQQQTNRVMLLIQTINKWYYLNYTSIYIAITHISLIICPFRDLSTDISDSSLA